MGTIPTELLSSHTSWSVVLILSSEPTYTHLYSSTHQGLWNDTVAEPILPEDSLIRLTLSNGDGLIGMTLMEHRAPTAGALAKSDGFQVKEENHGLEGRICMDLLVASLHHVTTFLCIQGTKWFSHTSATKIKFTTCWGIFYCFWKHVGHVEPWFSGRPEHTNKMSSKSRRNEAKAIAFAIWPHMSNHVYKMCFDNSLFFHDCVMHAY